MTAGLIANCTRPSLLCRVELVELAAKPVVVIEVPPARLMQKTGSEARKEGW